MTSLRVTFDGDDWIVLPATGLSFGRQADLVVDTSRHLAARVGAFRFFDEAWWLVNLSPATDLTIVDAATERAVTLSPSKSIELPFTECSVVFNGGAAFYELVVSTNANLSEAATRIS